MSQLTESDIERLLKEPTPEARAEAAGKVAGVHGRPDLTPRERTLAESIFRLMMKDSDVRVRQALSDQLKHNPLVPHDVAMALARDVEEVAVPMLHCSLVFSDDDLIELLRSRPPACQKAIAGREKVSEQVAEAVAEYGAEEAVAVLVRNPGAQVTERVGAKIIDMFSRSEIVMDGLAERPGLAIGLAERLVTLVSENIRLQLANAYNLPQLLSDRLVALSREQATLDLLPDGSTLGEVEAFVRQLHAKGRLTPSLVFRALVQGNLMFFEASIARLCGIRHANARALVHDQGPLGLRSVIEASHLPDRMVEPIKLAVETARALGWNGSPAGREAYRRCVVEAFAIRLDGLDPGNLEGLIARVVFADFDLVHAKVATPLVA